MKFIKIFLNLVVLSGFIIIEVRHWYIQPNQYEKLAFRAFGDSRYWWVIAWINKRPGDFSNEIGDVIFIPINLEEALSVLET